MFSRIITTTITIIIIIITTIIIIIIITFAQYFLFAHIYDSIGAAFNATCACEISCHGVDVMRQL